MKSFISRNSLDLSHSMCGNLAFVLRKAWQMDRVLMTVTVLQMPVLVLLPLCATYLSS